MNNNLAKYVKESGMLNKEFAEKSGISVMTYNRYKKVNEHRI